MRRIDAGNRRVGLRAVPGRVDVSAARKQNAVTGRDDIRRGEAGEVFHITRVDGSTLHVAKRAP